MGLIQELKSLGVNTDEALERMGGNSSFYERMLVIFRDMIKKSPIRMDFDCNDYSDVVEIAHALKGASGNLSLTPIYEAYSEMVRLLRADQPEQARQVLKKLLPVQAAIIDCIEKYS